MSATLASLIKHPMVFKGNDQRSSGEADRRRIPFGQPQLDKACVGGVPEAGVLSIRALPGSAEITLIEKVLIQKTAAKKRFIWLNNQQQLNPNWLCQTALSDQSWIVTTQTPEESLWACEQSVRSQACCCIVMYTANIHHKAARRLQVLANQYDCLVVIIQSDIANAQILPVNIDMSLIYQQPHWHVQLHRVKGGWPHSKIDIANPLPASNHAISKAFALYSSGTATPLHEVS